MERVRTNWGLNYTIEYPDVQPIPRPKDTHRYARTWSNIIWSFLESGREIMKIIPPAEIPPENASVSISRHLIAHEYPCPIRYFQRDGALYVYRVF